MQEKSQLLGDITQNPTIKIIKAGIRKPRINFILIDIKTPLIKH
jgi:hypothetical protein